MVPRDPISSNHPPTQENYSICSFTFILLQRHNLYKKESCRIKNGGRPFPLSLFTMLPKPALGAGESSLFGALPSFIIFKLAIIETSSDINAKCFNHFPLNTATNSATSYTLKYLNSCYVYKWRCRNNLIETMFIN